MIAYIESGGFILPFIVSALVGITVAVRIYWRKITSLFRRGKRR